jgi:iron transport multicopper oxidase
MNPGVYGVNANAYVLKKGDIVELVVNNFDDGAHPMHLHGHTAQLVARAPGVYHPPSADPKSHHHHGKEGQQETLRDIMGYAGDTSKMPRSPMRRDTWIVAENGYTVLRFVADNPGVWFFHCHMDWHLSAGLAATLVVAPLELQKTQSVPKAFQDMCRAQGIPISGNAAGNTEDFLNLTGANTVCPPL